MLNAQTVSVNSARLHREIENRQCLDQRLAGAACADSVQWIIESGKTGKISRSRELPAVRERAHGGKRSIHAGVAHRIQKRAVEIHATAAANHGLAFAEWIPNKTESRGEEGTAAVRQTTGSISLESLQVWIGDVRILRQ